MREGLLIAGKYTLLSPLGAGGMGTVWRGRNELTEREFAIKLLHAAAANNPRLLMRFFQEAKVSGRLRHPSILEIFDVGTAPELGGAPFLVMELLEGASVDNFIAERGPMSVRMTLQVLIAICHALSLAHERGIVHRDIKPGNIFLHRNISGGVVPKLLDFGISKIAATSSPDATIGLTQTGAVLGSPLYMSPEQAAGDRDLDARSDIHSLGVVLWECLTAKTPFKAETYNNLVVEIMTGDRPRLRETFASVSDELSEIASRAFARRPEDRFASTLELAAALEAELEKLGPGRSLDAKGLADELFPAAGAAAPRVAPDAPKAHSSTTGAMSVPAPSEGANAPRDLSRSPAAYTMATSSPGPLAYAQTEVADHRRAQSTQGEGASAILTNDFSADAPAPSKRSRLVLAGAVAAIITALGVGVAGVRAVVFSPSTPRIAGPIATPEPSLAPSPPPPPESESEVVVAPAISVGVPTAVAAVDAGTSAPPARPRAAPRTSPAVTAPARTAPSAAPAPVDDPHHGITNSGL